MLKEAQSAWPALVYKEEVVRECGRCCPQGSSVVRLGLPGDVDIRFITL